MHASREIAAKSHYEVLNYYLERYNKDVEEGRVVPFTYPMCTFGVFVLFLLLMSPPDSIAENKILKSMVLAAISAFHTWLIVFCRSPHPAFSFGIGIMAAWGTLWAATLLVFQKPKLDFRRVQSRSETEKQPSPSSIDVATSTADLSSTIRQRNTTLDAQPPPKELNVKIYHWQAFPASIEVRIGWVSDLIASFRGMGWNWKITTIPQRPPAVEKDLQSHVSGGPEKTDSSISRNGIVRFDTLQPLIKHHLWQIGKGYVCADVLKTMANHDPYFWGYMNVPGPMWMPPVLRDSSFVVNSYRYGSTMAAVLICLNSLNSLAPLLFAGVLGPGILGVGGEPWMYPDYWGSYKIVLELGLSGWWGAWWHQMFRFAFQKAGDWITDQLPVQRRSSQANLIQLVVAFLLSGLIHTSASISTLGETSPWRGSFLFFMVQPLGITIERIWSHALKAARTGDRMPKSLTYAINILYVHTWFYFTARLLADDWAKGGLWLFEPVPFSPLRGMGLGVKGDRFYCWEGLRYPWYSSSQWWQSGIVL